MPLKILIALAMVNKSPVTTCRGSLSGIAGIHTDNLSHRIHPGRFQRLDSERAETSERTEVDVFTRLSGQHEKCLFNNNTNVSLWQAYELHRHYISARVFRVLKCRRRSHRSVSFCFLTLQSCARGQIENQETEKAGRQVD